MTQIHENKRWGALLDMRKRGAPEELLYAQVLRACVAAGLLLLAFTFLLYMVGLPQPRIPVDQLPQYWGLPVDQFVRATHAPTGWTWLALLRHSDMLNLVGIALLAAASAFSSLAVLPVLMRRGEFALFAIALLQVVVLAVSASNLLIGR
jgi:hypothetical protein